MNYYGIKRKSGINDDIIFLKQYSKNITYLRAIIEIEEYIEELENNVKDLSIPENWNC